MSNIYGWNIYSTILHILSCLENLRKTISKFLSLGTDRHFLLYFILVPWLSSNHTVFYTSLAFQLHNSFWLFGTDIGCLLRVLSFGDRYITLHFKLNTLANYC